MFLRVEFWALVWASLLIPITIFIVMIRIRKISRLVVGIIGVFLLILSGTDVLLLHKLNNIAKETLTLLDDKFFSSEYTFVIYVLPLFSAGIGINLLSHLLGSHLIIAELEYDHLKK